MLSLFSCWAPSNLSAIPTGCFVQRTALQLLGPTKDFCTGIGIAASVVVDERNTEMGGYGMQLVIGQFRPDPSGYGDRIDRLATPKPDAVLSDQGKENAQIEPRVVRRQLAACQIRSDLRP